jgi:uncharacterized delta-60 repeat protein
MISAALATVAAVALAGGAPAAEAAPGALDPAFGNGGTVLTDLGTTGLDGMAIEPDGKVVTLEGGFQRVQRFLPDGTPDPSFGSGGVAEPLVAPAFWTRALALQPDGKIVIAGYDSAYDFAVARLMPDGKLDPDFDGDSGTGNGVVHTPLTPSSDMASSVGVDKLGRIVVAGTASDDDVGIVRYLPNGKLDKSFAGDGSLVDITPIASEEAFALAVRDDGILVAGGSSYDSFVARYTGQGATDASFGQYGRRVVDGGEWDRAESLAVQSDGTIVLGVFASAPNSHPPDSIVALTPGGDVDQGFGSAGRVVFDGGIHAVAVAPDDKVVFAGYGGTDGDTGFAVVRLNADGSPDTSFAGGAPVLTRFQAGDSAHASRAALAPDGKILLGGYVLHSQPADREVALARYLVDPDPPGGTGPAGGGPQPNPLALSGLKLTNRTFAVARGSTPAVGHALAARSRRRGTAFVFTLNRAATVTIRVKRLRPGAKVMKLIRSTSAGRNRVRFTGRVRRHALRPGLYRATLTAKDSAGSRTAPKAVKFRIVRR